MLKNTQGFTLIETMIALIFISALLSISIIQSHRNKMQQDVMYHQTNAYHILDNVLMERIHEHKDIEKEATLRYNEKFEKDREGIYLVKVYQEEEFIKIYLFETMKEVLHYDYQQ